MITPSESRPVFVYDGDCGFCSTTARFIRKWVDRSELVSIKPWQSLDLASLSLTEQQCIDAAQFVSLDGSARAGHRAIAAALTHGPLAWRIVGRILTLGPIDWVAGRVYIWVAAHRTMLPGGSPTCDVRRS